MSKIGTGLAEEEVVELIKKNLRVRVEVGSKVTVRLHWGNDCWGADEISSDYDSLPSNSDECKYC